MPTKPSPRVEEVFDRLEEIHGILDRGEETMFALGTEPQNIEPRLILAGGGVERMQEGMLRTAFLHQKQVREYLHRLKVAGLDRSVKEYEPLKALDGGPDGLVIHRRILADAPARLTPGGRIFLEIAFDHGELAQQIMAEYPAFDEARILKDYGGRDRVVTARRI